MEEKEYWMDNILDKLVISLQRNKVVCTPFYTPQEIAKIEKELRNRKENRFLL